MRVDPAETPEELKAIKNSSSCSSPFFGAKSILRTKIRTMLRRIPKQKRTVSIPTPR